MFELQVRPQHASTQNNCNCPLPIYQHGRACQRRITTSCNENKSEYILHPSNCPEKKTNQLLQNPPPFRVDFVESLRPQPWHLAKMMGTLASGHLAIAVLFSWILEMKRCKGFGKRSMIYLYSYVYIMFISKPPQKKKHWHPCFFFKSQMPHGHSSKLPQSKNAIKTWRLQYFDLTWTCL